MKVAHSKPLLWGVMILQALPIPLSLMTIIGSLISLANLGMTAEQYSPWTAVCAVVTMILAGTYVIPYVVAAVMTAVRKRLGWVSFLPVLHIVMTAVFCVMWVMSEGM
ncbi:MAG: hypothetical protein IJA91_05265 [Clostridia bacterium]|nr:hypothetical protein [Clostridia bacterium]